MAGRDTRARYEGVYARHAAGCAKTADKGAACDCRPSYFGVVYDQKAGKTRKTKHFPTVSAARSARGDLAAALREGKPVGSSGMRLETAAEKFVAAAADGIALTKHGRRYKPGAVIDLRSSLKRVPTTLQSRRLDDIGRGDVQRMVDDFSADGLSGSRVRSVVNALRALYRWGVQREFATANPAADVHLPAMDSEPRDRVATPAELDELLSYLDDQDALAFALAAFTSARAAEIRKLDWTDVDLKAGTVRLAGAGGKSAAATRTLPIVAPLRARLKAERLRQGRPAKGRVCQPRRASKSGELATGQLLKRARRAWKAAEAEAKEKGRKLTLTPIDLHECRHTCATWLDHAGVSPKVASQWMGHATPEAQAGAARITLSRYTHVLPDELERAGDQLNAFLVERTKPNLREVPRG